jgi:hypothetical protein
MGADDRLPEIVLNPVEQVVIPFYGHELVAVRLADGRIAAVLRWLCDGMGLEITAQVRRIRRKAALRKDLVMVRVETAGGPQAMPALVLHGLPGWLYGIDETRVGSDETREAVILFQCEATDVLARHFSQRQAQLAPPADLVPSKPIAKPERPAQDAGREAWIDYHQAMAAWLQWQQDVDRWRAQMSERQDALETRMESAEAVLQLVPEILERLGPETLTPEHQRTIQNAAKRLHEVGGYAYATIYAELGEYFHVAKYDQIPEARWNEVAEWFRARLDTAEKRARRG